MSAALVAAVASLMASINASVRLRLDKTIGVTDLVYETTAAGRGFDASVLEDIRAWPETDIAFGRLRNDVGVRVLTTGMVETDDGSFAPGELRLLAAAQAIGLDFEAEAGTRPFTMLAGRLPTGPNEAIIDALLARRLSAEDQRRSRDLFGGFGFDEDITLFDDPLPTLPDRVDTEAEADEANAGVAVRVGDTLQITRGLFRQPVEVTIVGVSELPPLGGQSRIYMTAETLGQALDRPGQLNSIDIVLRDGLDPEAVVDARLADAPAGIAIRPTARVTSSVDQNLKSSQLGMLLASILAFLTAAFIVMTGLNTDAAERERELAMIRCIGASRPQIAAGQLTVGAIIAFFGALIGIPLGLLMALTATIIFEDQIPAGLSVPVMAWLMPTLGALGSGLLGAAWPAWRSSRVSPLRAMQSRAAPAKPSGLVLFAIIGVVGALTHLAVVGIPDDGEVVFWGYVTVGLPGLFFGYFALAIPAAWLAARVAGPIVSKALGLPGGILRRTVAGSPGRYGLTAGAMMAGLSLMVAIWTQGGSALRDWIQQIKFADAFVHGLHIDEQKQSVVNQLDFVERTCAISVHPVTPQQDAALGVRSITSYGSSFIAFEPDPFFEMSNLNFVQGDAESARVALNKGGAILVAREFMVARGLGVGDTFSCRNFGDEDAEPHTFEIVGVVDSPGLDIVNKFFNIGEEYGHMSLHAVFGSRDDLRNLFNSDSIQLLQIDLADDIDDAEAIGTIRSTMIDQGVAVIAAGSGRAILAEITAFIERTLFAFSAIAALSMLVACFGVANVIAASVHGRKFELGVLRAVGASRGLVVRLIAAESVLIAIVASILGTLMGIQGSFAGKRLNETLFGIEFDLVPPPLPILAGCALVLVMCVGAAMPSLLRLNRQGPRELLSARNA
ncbi:MAG: FtsX-like permease family protein [Planctomycetota bacterium]